ncbi:NUDIX hydrolase [Peribacillus sp. SCS-37]|uniref:NUDIX hydrolase n=1 Tax=Paraperibacillus esterisolvens TaxID=3115296 RepID=UPI003905B766
MGYIMDLRKAIGTRPIVMAGAAVLLIHEEKGLLLQLRTDNFSWGLAGGSMEPGESFEETAARELYEETGLVAKELRLLSLFSGKDFYYKYPNGDEVFNVIAAYICTDYDGKLDAGREEVSQLQFFRPEKLPGNLNPADRPIIGQCIKNYWGETF